MLHNYEFRDFVLRESFKHYFFDSSKRRIEEIRSLDAHEKTAIVDKWKTYGFHSKDEASDTISKILNSTDNNGVWESVTELNCLDCCSGTAIEIGTEYNKKLRLLYLDDFVFFVCSDDSHLLHYGDLLTTLCGGITVRHPAYFMVRRDGQTYPKSGMTIMLPIESVRRSAVNRNKNCKETQKVASQQSMTNIYAYMPKYDQRMAWFDEDILTDNSSAAFSLDLVHHTFGLSPQFNYHDYRDVNVINDVLHPVAKLDGMEWHNLRLSKLKMVESGSFEFDDKRYFVILQKMLITSE